MHVCIIYTSYPTPDKDVRQIRPELHEGFRKRRKGFRQLSTPDASAPAPIFQAATVSRKCTKSTDRFT